MNPRKEERNQKMLEDRRSGMYYKDIAKKYGLTKDRARKIVMNQERWNNEEIKKIQEREGEQNES